MDHKLQLVVGLDADLKTARIDVQGCLTAASCQALLCVLRRAHSLAADVSLTLDLREARHLETEALEMLGYLPAPSSANATAIYSEVRCVLEGVGVVVLLLPKLSPVCRMDRVPADTYSDVARLLHLHSA
ncbi:hypothetical protein [Crystallibacter degradans]|uniref:hypothetical protein n=1 Tax=Crystallibacter degradans TaxID=2726743 RepID=UPI001474A14C|nr:hypothetical protein [Arthrobacter sp. SF27]NMR30793.1 hypothetical protein [Arthrobacter sp. SF27]